MPVDRGDEDRGGEDEQDACGAGELEREEDVHLREVLRRAGDEGVCRFAVRCKVASEGSCEDRVVGKRVGRSRTYGA